MDYVTSRRSLLRQNGFALSKTSGKSMRPLIWGGQHCVAVIPLDGEPKVGDLLMFRQSTAGEGMNIVHRLVDVRLGSDGEPLYITRGDNCLGSETVRRSDIIGRVAEVHRMSGFRPWHIIPARRFSVDGCACCMYSRLWMVTWCVRRPCYALRARVAALYHHILH